MFFLSLTSYPDERRKLAKSGTPALSNTAFLIANTSFEGATVVVSLFLVALELKTSSISHIFKQF